MDAWNTSFLSAWPISGAMLASGSVVFQKILQSYLVKRCLEPLKAEPQEVFGSLSTDPRKVIFSEHQGYVVYRFQWVSVENMTLPHPKSLVRGKCVWMLDFLHECWNIFFQFGFPRSALPESSHSTLQKCRYVIMFPFRRGDFQIAAKWAPTSYCVSGLR